MIVTLMIGAENFGGKDMTNSWSLDQPEKNLCLERVKTDI